ncbi:MAG: DUF2330 domain-containing protein, partial [Myxococcales bacterium]|nr:DUF2330 domain-containing protein [Myxococcales bacterium]
MNLSRLSLPLFALSLAATLLSPASARACGGFFCSASAPVNQAAERIIFAKHPDGRVSAIVQIQYTGPSELFAWVLPVPGIPEVGVSSNVAFSRLQALTNPVYRLQTRVEGSCGRDRSLASGGGLDASLSGSADASIDAGTSVSIVGEGSVGPYDWVTISLDPATPNPGDVAVSWLQDNGYDVDDFGRDRLAPYLADGMNLIAFRLSKGNAVGEIRPVFLTYDAPCPRIPILPTAVAAEDDMGVLVWVLGESRAIPENYFSLELNDALIDWFSPSATYDAVVTAAADEAGGKGFVTEMAGRRADLPGLLLQPFEDTAIDDLRTSAAGGAMGGQIVLEALGIFGGWDGIRGVVQAHLPLEPGLALEDFLACPFCYLSWDASIPGFDAVAFLDALEADVLAPMRASQALFDDFYYVTRLYTTMSAVDMTLDPEFEFNSTLPDVSNLHVAERVIECASDRAVSTAPWRAVLPSGQLVRGTGSSWPFRFTDGAMPLNRELRQLDTVGE